MYSHFQSFKTNKHQQNRNETKNKEDLQLILVELKRSTCFSWAAAFGFLSLQHTKQQGQLSPNTPQEPSPHTWPYGTVPCLLIIVPTKKPEVRLSFNNVDAVIIVQSKVINLIQLSYESWHGMNFAWYEYACIYIYMHVIYVICNIILHT